MGSGEQEAPKENGAGSVTTEDLREALFSALKDVAAGTMKRETALTMCSISDKIIRSAEYELKYANTILHLTKAGVNVSVGRVVLVPSKLLNHE